ncbi:MAG: DUF533 domain-containing protein [Alphaproteobacteria bacterium]
MEQTVSKSKFYMLRCLVAMAHADNALHDDERAYIEGMMENLPLSAEQKETLYADLETPQSVASLYQNIEEPRFKGQLVYFARIMAHKDGVLDPSEDALLERMQKYALDETDLDAIKAQAREAVKADMLQHDIAMHRERPVKNGVNYAFFQWLDDGLRALGINFLHD